MKTNRRLTRYRPGICNVSILRIATAALPLRDDGRNGFEGRAQRYWRLICR